MVRAGCQNRQQGLNYAETDSPKLAQVVSTKGAPKNAEMEQSKAHPGRM